MCGTAGPMVAMMVIAAASTAVQQYQSNKQRGAAQDAADKQEKLAKEAEENQLEALDAQMEQVQDQGELQKMDRQRQALRERAKIRVAASESGAFGQSTLKELSASQIGEGFDTGIIDYNVRAQAGQIGRQREGIKTSTKAGIANVRASVPQGTPAWMSGLNIGLAGASQFRPTGGGGGTATPHIPAL